MPSTLLDTVGDKRKTGFAPWFPKINSLQKQNQYTWKNQQGIEASTHLRGQTYREDFKIERREEFFIIIDKKFVEQISSGRRRINTIKR